MNLLKTILLNSVMYKVFHCFMQAYNESYFRKFVDSISAAYNNSYAMNLMLGKQNRGSYYEESKLYVWISKVIKLLDKAFLWLSKKYIPIQENSFFIGVLVNTSSRFKKSSLKSLTILSLGFSVGYLIFNLRIGTLGILLVINAVLGVITLYEKYLLQALKNSVSFKLYKYFLE